MNCWRCESTNNLIHQDGIIKLFLSTEPITLGHCILTSVAHFSNIENMSEYDFLELQGEIYKWNRILKKTFEVQDLFILFMNHHIPEEKHVYWHLLPISKKDKPDFRYNYTWFGRQAEIVNARHGSTHLKSITIARRKIESEVIGLK